MLGRASGGGGDGGGGGALALATRGGVGSALLALGVGGAADDGVGGGGGVVWDRCGAAVGWAIGARGVRVVVVIVIGNIVLVALLGEVVGSALGLVARLGLVLHLAGARWAGRSRRGRDVPAVDEVDDDDGRLGVRFDAEALGDRLQAAAGQRAKLVGGARGGGGGGGGGVWDVRRARVVGVAVGAATLVDPRRVVGPAKCRRQLELGLRAGWAWAAGGRGEVAVGGD